MCSCGGSPRPAPCRADRRYKLTICPRARPTRAGGIPHGASVAAVGLRSRSVVAAGALLVIVLSGCAATMETKAGTAPCVPPGMPPVATWVVRDARVVMMRAPDRQTVFAALVDYQVGPAHVRAMWIGWGLIFV